MTGGSAPTARQRRRLDRFGLVWPLAAAIVTAATIAEDRRVGEPFTWSSLAAGAAVLAIGAFTYVVCRLNLRRWDRLLAAAKRR